MGQIGIEAKQLVSLIVRVATKAVIIAMPLVFVRYYKEKMLFLDAILIAVTLGSYFIYLYYHDSFLKEKLEGLFGKKVE
jgi:hypothetical protein